MSEGQALDNLQGLKMLSVVSFQDSSQFLYFLLAWPLKSADSHHLGQPKAMKWEREITWKKSPCMPRLPYLPQSDPNPWNDFDAWLIPVGQTCCWHTPRRRHGCLSHGWSPVPVKPPAYKWALWSPETLQLFGELSRTTCLPLPPGFILSPLTFCCFIVGQ